MAQAAPFSGEFGENIEEMVGMPIVILRERETCNPETTEQPQVGLETTCPV